MLAEDSESLYDASMQRNSTYQGQRIELTGSTRKVRVWINDKQACGDITFPSLRSAKSAAVSYIIRHPEKAI